MKHATWQMTRIGPAKTGTYHWAAMCEIAPVAAACGNATRRSREPTTVQAQAKPRAAGQPFRSRLTGDPSLSKRPMRRVIDPLTQMGASIRAEGSGDRPPLVIEGGPLKPIHYFSPVASAQV